LKAVTDTYRLKSKILLVIYMGQAVVARSGMLRNNVFRVYAKQVQFT
jgi:hypothetical protein